MDIIVADFRLCQQADLDLHDNSNAVEPYQRHIFFALQHAFRMVSWYFYSLRFEPCIVFFALRLVCLLPPGWIQFDNALRRRVTVCSKRLPFRHRAFPSLPLA